MVGSLMQASKFSEETAVVNKLKLVLLDNDWTLIQLVSPSGQAHYSITFSEENKNCIPRFGGVQRWTDFSWRS